MDYNTGMMTMATKIESMMTAKQVADSVPMSLGALRVLAHRGGFIEADLTIGNNKLYQRKRVQEWKRDRERAKRRKSK
jgi:hypothetical protein